MNTDLISRQDAIDAIKNQTCLTYEEIFNRCLVSIKDENGWVGGIKDAIEALIDLPSAQPEIIRCKECEHQEKIFQTDRRRKDGGYYIYGCEFAEGYSHVCLDDDFCSRAERRTDA